MSEHPSIFDAPITDEKIMFAGYDPPTDKVALAICLAKGTTHTPGGKSPAAVLSHIIMDRVEFIDWLRQMEEWSKWLTSVEGPTGLTDTRTMEE